MYTLEQIKSYYYYELARGWENMGFDEYLKKNYVQVYDAELNFIGYEQLQETTGIYTKLNV